MMNTKSILISILLAAASLDNNIGAVHGAGIRGGSSTGNDVDLDGYDNTDTSAGRSRKLSEEITNLQMCGQVSNSAKNDQYFWMNLMNSGTVVLGTCLLKVPKGADNGDWNCCTVSGTTTFHNDGNLAASDPYVVTNSTNAQAYALCGRDGGAACPTYDYDNNQNSFRAFKIRDGENDEKIRTMDSWMAKKDRCGMTKKGSQCVVAGIPEYNHVHIGKDYCLSGGMSIARPTSDCQAWGWKCKDSDC